MMCNEIKAYHANSREIAAQIEPMFTPCFKYVNETGDSNYREQIATWNGALDVMTNLIQLT